MILLALAAYVSFAHNDTLHSTACANALCMQLAASTPAPAPCPWLTKGTAVAALGGEVTTRIVAPESMKGSCSYSLLTSPAASIEVVVDTSPLPACPANATALKGIGNEALRCKIPAKPNEREMISGRVRNHYFTVTIRATTHATSNSEESDWLQRIAEQVAGNLF